MKSATILSSLEKWYQSNCNGVWEHRNGIKISCIDNPGWSVCIDLEGTSLEHKSMANISLDKSDDDWIHCEVKGLQFTGHGDPHKLSAILQVFLEFSRE